MNAPVSLSAGALDAMGVADALVLVGPAPFSHLQLSAPLRAAVDAQLAVDRALGAGQVAVAACEAAPGGRLVLAPTGGLQHWTDDVRRYAEAALLGVRRAAVAGASRPCLVVECDPRARFAQAQAVAAAAGVRAAWGHPQWGGAPAIDEVSVAAGDGAQVGDVDLARARALAAGRALAADLTAGDPEFAAPERFAATCEEAFAGSAVAAEIDRDVDAMVARNPLLGAVARASLAVPRHHPRVVKLTYRGDRVDASTPHWLFAGKGVTYDTGGADLKVGGAMRGMSMDKGGAAGVAGFFALLAAMRPAGVRATAYLGCVRNSVGADAYVSDEVITSRGGAQIVVGNTDAEGRMVLADMLTALVEEAGPSGDAVAFSVATLTGHVIRAYGSYAAVMGNGAAVEAGWPQRIVGAGDAWGDPFEHSRIRREDYDFITAKNAGGPWVQCNSAASSATPRGHQFPFAFLDKASGLAAHDLGSERPIPYLHLDMAGACEFSGGPLAGLPTGSPVAALAGALLWGERGASA